MIRFAFGKKPRDYPGYELTCESSDNVCFTSCPATADELLSDLKKFTQKFRPGVISITYYDHGPFVVPEQGEENRLSCWHNEPGDRDGVMIKWALKDAEAYRFVEGNVLDHVAELLSTGAEILTDYGLV